MRSGRRAYALWAAGLRTLRDRTTTHRGTGKENSNTHLNLKEHKVGRVPGSDERTFERSSRPRTNALRPKTSERSSRHGQKRLSAANVDLNSSRSRTSAPRPKTIERSSRHDQKPLSAGLWLMDYRHLYQNSLMTRSRCLKDVN